jgi:VWFA-related protein
MLKQPIVCERTLKHMRTSFVAWKTYRTPRLLRRLSLAALLLLALAVGNLCAPQQSQSPAPTQGQQPPPPQQQTPPPAQPAQQPSSQEPQLKIRTQNQQAPITVEVKTVTVLAVVRDKHGKIIPDLKKEDFQLEEDSRPQKIDYFARESDLPLRLGLLVDTSLSQRRVLDQERDASYSFLDHLMRDKDQAFVLHFDREVELLQDFTPSRPKLQAALQELSLPQSDSGSSSGGGGGNGNGGGGYGGYPGGGGGRHGGGMHGGGTQLYDAIYLGADELMSKQQGRKAMIILSDGVDHGSKETMAEAIATAQRADTLIYSVYFSDEDEGGGFNRGGFGMGGPGMGRRGGGYPQQQRPDGKKILEQISEQTGGRLFKASKKETLDKIYAEIDEDLRNQYNMAYTPDKGNSVGYHKIHLTVPNQKDLVVTARDGYYYGQ